MSDTLRRRPTFPRAALAAGLSVSLLLGACASPGPALSDDGVFKLPPQRAEYHRLRFMDGQVSRNDSCMIRMENALNPRIPPLYVNGEPLGFC